MRARRSEDARTSSVGKEVEFAGGSTNQSCWPTMPREILVSKSPTSVSPKFPESASPACCTVGSFNSGRTIGDLLIPHQRSIGRVQLTSDDHPEKVRKIPISVSCEANGDRVGHSLQCAMDCVISEAAGLATPRVCLQFRAGSSPNTVPLPTINQKVTIMFNRTTTITLTLIALLSAAPLLGACHTTAGAGQDISDAGHAIKHDANRETPGN